MFLDPGNAETLQEVKKVASFLQENPKTALAESERVHALKAAKRLVSLLEKPEDALLTFAYNLYIFPMLSEKEHTSAHEIAERTSASEVLIRRLLRVLTASDFVAERGPGVYGPTKWTEQLHQRKTVGMVKFIYDIPMPAIAAVPKWLRDTGYQNPNDPKNGIHQLINGTQEEMFPWLAKPGNEELWESANAFFEGDRGSRPSWVTWFPVKEKLLDGSTSDLPLMVDVAGGRGHDITEFLDHFPGEPGRIILQDQPAVLDSAIALSPKVEKVPIDFFKEAPVPNARIYFMKFIMHDYTDDQCLQILDNLTSSMKKGYSYLVINDFIIPDEGCSLLPAQWDLIMLIFLTAMERAESQWRTLLDKAGLKIEGLFQPPGDGQGIIVATLA